MSEDPLGLAPDKNLTRYTGNSPTNFVDPSGLDIIDIPVNDLPGSGDIDVDLPPAPYPPAPVPPDPTDQPVGEDIPPGGLVPLTPEEYEQMKEAEARELKKFFDWWDSLTPEQREDYRRSSRTVVCREELGGLYLGDKVRDYWDDLPYVGWLIGGLAGGFVDGVLPPSPPSVTVYYSDGTSMTFLSPGPSTGDLGGQGGMIIGSAAIMKHFRSGKCLDDIDDVARGIKIPNDKLKAPPKKRGHAPTGEDGHPVELHHRGQKPDSPLDEMTRTDHRGGKNFEKNHHNTGQHPSEIDRQKWNADRRQYWSDEFDSGRFDDMFPDKE